MYKNSPLWYTEAMIHFYCAKLHGCGMTCSQCSELLAFEKERVTVCAAQQTSSPCEQCDRQCYPDAKRLAINHVMQWSEKRFFWHHPFLSLKFFFNLKRESAKE